MDLLGLGEGLKERAGTENLRWVGGRVLARSEREEGTQRCVLHLSRLGDQIRSRTRLLLRNCVFNDYSKAMNNSRAQPILQDIRAHL